MAQNKMHAVLGLQLHAYLQEIKFILDTDFPVLINEGRKLKDIERHSDMMYM